MPIFSFQIYKIHVDFLGLNPDYALDFVMKVENTITRACKSELAKQIWCSRTFFDEGNEVQ